MPNRVLLRYGIVGVAFLMLEISLILFADKPLALTLRAFGVAHPDVLAFFHAITDIGLGKWYAAPSALGAVLCCALLRVGRWQEFARHRLDASMRALAFFFASTSCAGLVTDALKPLFGRARPKFLADGTYGFDPMSFLPDWNGMPSGHSTTAFAVAFTLIVFFPKYRVPLALFAAMIGLSRLMVGAHFLSDVLAGAAVAFTVTHGLTKIFVRRGWLGMATAT